MEVRDLFITGEGLPLEPILERIEPLIQLEKL
jgi:hypothetical protein